MGFVSRFRHRRWLAAHERLLLRNGSHRPSITDYRTTPTEPPRFERSIASPRHNGDLCPLRRSRIGKFSAPLPGAIHSVHDRVFMQTTQVAALKTTSSIRGQGVSDAAFSSLFDENAKLREQRVALRQKQLHDLELIVLLILLIPGSRPTQLMAISTSQLIGQRPLRQHRQILLSVRKLTKVVVRTPVTCLAYTTV